MHKWIFIAFFFLLAGQTEAQQKKRIYFYELDVINGLFYQPNTIKPYSGVAFDKFPNGKKRMEMPIRNGKVHGTSKEWMDTGQKILQSDYQDGIHHGRETQWYTIGQKKVEVNYINGQVEGEAIEWYKYGQKKSKGMFRLGKEEGEHIWWHDNGQRDQVVNYENGLAQGLVKSWFRSGNLRLESNYKDGKKNGLTVEWFENGKKYSEGNFREDKEDGKAYVWKNNGQLIKENTYDFGKLVEAKNYLSGAIYIGEGYLQVFNEMEDFFRVHVSGTTVKPRASEEIVYVVDGNLLQIFNQPTERYFSADLSNQSEKELLEKYVEQESQFIGKATSFNIEPKTKFEKNKKGKRYVHWHFVSPSSKDAEQKPRTVQEEHYISFVCGSRILSLYSVVTNNDDSKEIKTMLERIADSLQVETDRIDLNALVAKYK